MNPIRVFLDTNAISYSADHKVKQGYKAGSGKLQSAGKPDREITLAIPWARGHATGELPSGEDVLMREVVEFSKTGHLLFCWSHEVELELLFQPLLSDRFFGERVEHEQVLSAIDYRDEIPRFPAGESGCFISPGPVVRE